MLDPLSLSSVKVYENVSLNILHMHNFKKELLLMRERERERIFLNLFNLFNFFFI